MRRRNERGKVGGQKARSEFKLNGYRPDLVQIRTLAESKADENSRFRLFLKTRCKLDPDEIDQRVFETTRRVWAGIDCTTCANCCRELTPTFSEEEVDRVARRLGTERQQFIETYLERTEAHSDNPWQTRTIPCPFLKDNLCSIYEDRPGDCSGYLISTSRISCSAP
jgi:uncharacterized protein